jgi:hypothetical protein
MNLCQSLWRSILEDCLMAGAGMTKVGYRKWYNPLRWIVGKMYTKHIPPEDFFRCDKW